MKILKNSVKFYVYQLENRKKKTIETIILPKSENSKSLLINTLKLKGINFDGIDSVYPAMIGDDEI